MNAGQSITAVVPVHNRADLLERLLASVRAQSRPFDEVLAIDNASQDNAVEVARLGGARVIPMGENTGFARAVNAGWRAAATEWVAILNSDVELEPAWVERMLGGAGAASFAAGTILSASKAETVDGTYDLVSRGGCAWRAGHGEKPATEAHGPLAIAIAPGTACLFRRSVLEKLGGFDEMFGSYLEDVDLGLRCIREGFEGVYVPEATAWHHGSATFGKWNPAVVRLISRNQLLLVSRHYDRALFRSCLWPIFLGQMLWGLVALRHGAFAAWLAGKYDGLRDFAPRGVASPSVRAFLHASEAEIRARARDSYWRWYFRLTASAAN